MSEERVYNINLRSAWLKSPRTFRANKSVSTIKKFLTRHMNAQDVKISQTVNELIWIRGAKKPPGSIQIKASKDDEGVVTVMLPDEKIETKETKTLKDKILRRSKKREEVEKKEKAKEMTEEEKKEFETFKKSKGKPEIAKKEIEETTPEKTEEKKEEAPAKESKAEKTPTKEETKTEKKAEKTTSKKPTDKKKSK